MKKTILAVLLSAFAFGANANVNKAEANLKKKYPATNFTQISSTPVKGIYEVIMGKNVAYTDVEGRYFIFGNLYDMQTQQDITSSTDKPIKTTFPSQHLADAIKEVKGNGSRKLVVFSDPDCPYCARLEENLLTLDNVTIYTFLYPLEQIHPTAKSTAISIWCAEDRVKAYSDYMISKIKPTVKSCANPLDRNIQLGGSYGVQGTPTLIFEDGTLLAGAMPKEAIEEQLQKSAMQGGN
ncbi:DsbC family protein (plasmid) [Acinetobacter indicus]|uniref:DsbC family protein n=1 Tax=Acinetobacter indicus TaxID=756892 RepID=UPI001FA6B182|nr:DsbC family protein [Acinetobacter indicus]UNW11126.1 DsbC family protein [Acinetobacter indicus]